MQAKVSRADFNRHAEPMLTLIALVQYLIRWVPWPMSTATDLVCTLGSHELNTRKIETSRKHDDTTDWTGSQALMATRPSDMPVKDMEADRLHGHVEQPVRKVSPHGCMTEPRERIWVRQRIVERLIAGSRSSRL